MKILAKLFPILQWLPKYERGDARGDIIAGLTVAVMIIPQAIAYGLLAGVPPEVALYASIVPMTIYALLGSCRELSVGPAALISLMSAQAIHQLRPEAEMGGPEWVAMAVLIAVLVGVVQLGLGLVKLGVVVQFLSRPVVSGFMSAAALIIASSQLSLLMGTSVEGSGFVGVMSGAVDAIPRLHQPTLLLGVICIAAMVGSRMLWKSFPMPFVLVVLTTALSWMFGFSESGIAVVGTVQGGLPSLVIPEVSMDQVVELLPYVIVIALVGFLESISVAKAYGFQNHYDVDANQELRAIGAANVLGGLFGGYVTTGNISRTVVSAQAGAKSQLYALITAALVLLTVMLLAPLFQHLPKAMLAAMIVVAVMGIVDVKEAMRLAGFKLHDAAALVLTFAATLAFGVEIGILTGVSSSLVLHLYQTTKPHFAILGRLPGTSHWREVERHPEAIIEDEVIVIRIDESLYFANAPSLRDVVEHAYNVHPAHPRGFVLDCMAVNDLDSSALDVIQQIADEMKLEDTQLCLAGVSVPIHDILEKSGCLAHIGEKALFTTVHDAVLSFGIGEPTEEYVSGRKAVSLSREGVRGTEGLDTEEQLNPESSSN
jgi:SulP family sulfate permease